MTIEEFLDHHSRIIEIIANQTGLAEPKVQELFRLAWEEGYFFRANEETVNKGASF